MAAHSKLGASSASRWMACPGSVRLSKDIPESSSTYAREGTAAHTLAEMCLKLGVDAEVLAYTDIAVDYYENGEKLVEVFQVTEDMVDAVQVYLDTVRPYMVAAEAQKGEKWDKPAYAFETRFDLSRIHEGMFGTNDFSAVLLQDRLLVVADYKHGAGVSVEVDGNKQLMYYAVGALLSVHADQVDEVELIVVQPRAAHLSGGVRKARYSAKWLRETFAKDLSNAAKATEKEDAPLAAGDHCCWCPAKGFCPARHNQMTTTIGARYDTAYRLPEVSTLTPADMSKVLESKKAIEDWLDAVQKAATDIALSGGEVPEYKLVRSSKNRTYVNKEAAMAELTMLYGDSVLKKDLVGLGDLEKFLKTQLGTKKAVDDYMNSLVYKPEGDIVLAPVVDKRPEYKVGQLLEAIG